MTVFSPLRIAEEDPNILVVSSDTLEDENYDQDDRDYFAYDLAQKKNYWGICRPGLRPYI